MIQVEQVRLLYDQANIGLVATLLASLILGSYLLMVDATVSTIGPWWLATLLVALWRWRLNRQFRATQDASVKLPLWYHRFVLGATLAGLTWGIGGAAAAFEVSLINQTLILLVIATMVAGAILFLGPVVPAYTGYMLGAGLPLLAWMLWQRDTTHTVIAVLTLLFMTVTWLAVLRFSNLLSKVLYLKSKSNSLAGDLRIADEQIQDSDSMLAEAARTAMLGHWHFDEVAKEYLSISEEYARIFGYTRDEFLKLYRSLDDDMSLVIPEDREKALAGYASGSVEFDYRVVRKDGQIRYVREISNHILDEKGRLIEAKGTLQDITEIKQAQLEAERATLAKSEFLSRMSHELRTPMNAVLGFSQLLEIDPSLNQEQKSHVNHILGAGKHLLVLIEEVLDLERIDSGRIQLFMDAVDPGRILQECRQLIQPLADQNDVIIEVNTPAENIPAVWADKLRLKQVLLNLVSNGVKYNRKGGRVAVILEGGGKGKLRISIGDTGIGIPEERMGELFEPYSRLGAERSGIEGAGIGLTITKRLVELMGGNLGVETTQNLGCTFWLELDLDKSTESVVIPTSKVACEN